MVVTRLLVRSALMAVALPFTAAAGRERTASDGSTPTDVGAVAAQTDSLYFASSASNALTLCEGVFATGVDDARLRWRAARAAIAEGMLRVDLRERILLYDRALAHARRAYELAPADLEARYWVAAAAGRRVHIGDPVLSTRLAHEVYGHAAAILAADSMHAGAQHAMGMLHGEVLRLPRFVRFLASRILRNDLAGRANWTDAERHLRRAVDLQPDMIQYLVDLADLYGRAGRAADAETVLARLATVPMHHPMDRAIREACAARWRRT